jgi:hypothetical protein
MFKRLHEVCIILQKSRLPHQSAFDLLSKGPPSIVNQDDEMNFRLSSSIYHQLPRQYKLIVRHSLPNKPLNPPPFIVPKPPSTLEPLFSYYHHRSDMTICIIKSASIVHYYLIIYLAFAS